MDKDALDAMTARAVAAYRKTVLLTSSQKRDFLDAFADKLKAARAEILSANAEDLQHARELGRPQRLLDRLAISENQFDRMLRRIRDVAAIADIMGQTASSWVRPNRLDIRRIRVPVGVICVCCESRPFVFPLTVAMCFKTNNVMVFATDTEGTRTVRAFERVVKACEELPGFPKDAIQLLSEASHLEACRYLTSLDRSYDLAILRGSQDFVAEVSQYARIPVFKRCGRLCHVYVDCNHLEGTENKIVETDLTMAVQVTIASRCYLPDSCTSASVVLVHRDIAPRFLEVFQTAATQHGLHLKADARAKAFLPDATPAEPADFTNPSLEKTELAIGIVDSEEEAIERINTNGSALSDTIVTGSETAKQLFFSGVDSAVVYANASTCFTNGSEFGMGADIGISTDKLDVRGPIGLEALTSLKFVVRGAGQTRGGG